MNKLEGRVAIVTGGSRGIGAAITNCLRQEGAMVIVGDVIAPADDAPHFSLDVRREEDWRDLIDMVMAEHGRIDCLVNNAGVTHAATVEEAALADFQRLIDINLIGPFLGMKAVLPIMRRQGGGSIVNIASNSSRKIVAMASIYGATKAALANLSKAAAVDAGPAGIRINTVHPGPCATSMLLDQLKDPEALPQVRQMISSIPMGRLGEAAEIGSVVAFLASDDARYMTASELFVDGGVTVV